MHHGLVELAAIEDRKNAHNEADELQFFPLLLSKRWKRKLKS